jgi:hypothetical protein
MTERRCACGCGRSLAGMRKDAIWYSRACAVRWARSNPGKSLHEAYSANKGQTRSRSGPSGFQYPRRKTDDAVAFWIAATLHVGVEDARDEAKRILNPVLPARQREQLEQKEAA